MVPRTPDDYLPLSPSVFHVLISLSAGERHGYLIMREVSDRTQGKVRMSTGTLYGLIRRLLADGLIVEVPAGDPRRRAYRLTPFGRDVARAEAARLEALVDAARATRLLGRAGTR